MKKIVLPIAVLAMLALIAAAFALDCVRYASAARQCVALADEEMQKHETRLLKLLTGNPRLTPEVQTSLSALQGPEVPENRHGLYDGLVKSFRETMASKIDPNSTLDRKFMDDIAGVINRREIARKQYDDESAAYRRFLLSARGKIAQTFSPTARADAKPNESAN